MRRKNGVCVSSRLVSTSVCWTVKIYERKRKRVNGVELGWPCTQFKWWICIGCVIERRRSFLIDVLFFFCDAVKEQESKKRENEQGRKTTNVSEGEQMKHFNRLFCSHFGHVIFHFNMSSLMHIGILKLCPFFHQYRWACASQRRKMRDLSSDESELLRAQVRRWSMIARYWRYASSMLQNKHSSACEWMMQNNRMSSKRECF